MNSLKQVNLDKSRSTIENLLRNSSGYTEYDAVRREINGRRLNIAFFAKAEDELVCFNLGLGYMNPITMQNSNRLLLNLNSPFGDAVKKYADLKNFTNKTLFFVKNTCVNLKLYKICYHIISNNDDFSIEHQEDIKNNLDLVFKYNLNEFVDIYKSTKNKDVLFFKEIIDMNNSYSNRDLANLMAKLFNIQSINFEKMSNL